MPYYTKHRLEYKKLFSSTSTENTHIAFYPQHWYIITRLHTATTQNIKTSQILFSNVCLSVSFVFSNHMETKNVTKILSNQHMQQKPEVHIENKCQIPSN
jgi:hypothetical protein